MCSQLLVNQQVRLRLAFFCEKSTLYTAFLLFFRENYATGNVTMAYFSPLADFGAVAVFYRDADID